MSFDRRIDQLCPHLVVEEFLLPRDRTMVVPMRPISSASSVVVRANGLQEIPSFGVDIPASSGGTREGPFTIRLGVSDILKLKVNGGSWQTVVVQPGVRISAKQLSDSLNLGLIGVQFFADGSLLRFRTSLSGRDSSVYIHSDSTLATEVGIRVNREYRGKRVFPGWTLVRARNTLDDRPSRMVVFDEPLHSDSDFVEVNYTTVRQECRRCGGIGVENDWSYLNNGEVAQARKEDLLRQELQKIFYTIRGSNPFHPWYGTRLVEQIAQKLIVGGLVQNKITADIQTTFSRWQSIKKQQEESVGQLVEDEEFPFQLERVTLEQSQKDPTVLFVNMTIRNRSYRPIQLSRGLRTPLPTDLLGSTQQQALAKSVSLPNYSLVY